MKLYLSILKGLWVFGLLDWIYVVASVLDPITAPYQLANISYLVPVPTNFVGVSAFIISFFAFIGYEWKK